MDQYLSVIKFLFNKAGFENNDKSINSFFDEGRSFPQFISIIFKIQKVPETKEKPYSNYFKKLNNFLALQYLFEQNETIKKINPKYETDADKIDLIKLIFAHQCFKMTQNEIILTANLILNQVTHIYKYNDVSEIMNIKFLLSLLNALTNNTTDTNKLSNDNNFDMVINSFQEALVPLLIDQNTIKNKDKLIYLIQLQVIYDIFSEKINIIKRKSQRIKQSSEKNLKLTGINPDITINDTSIDKKDKLNGKTYQKIEYTQKKNVHDEFMTNIDIDNKIWYPQEAQDDSSMLMTINLIAFDLKICELNECNSFEFTLFNNFIPLFVMRYRNIETIPNLKKIERSKDDPLTYQEIKNIKIVIDYLKKEKKSFELLLFDFDSPFLFVNSVKLFFTIFLNTFFVSKTRIEMMERCNALIGDLKWYSKKKIFTKRRYDTFTALLSFINLTKEKKINNDETTSYDYFIDLAALFKETGVPMVITMDIIDDFYHDSDLPDSLYYQQSDKELPNPIVYQLQFIFDKIDSSPSLQLVEVLRSSNHKIKKIILPKFNAIKSMINSKIQGLKLKGRIKKVNLLKEEEKKQEEKQLNKKTTFLDRQKNLNFDSIQNKNNETFSKSKNLNKKNEDSIKYWNPKDKNCKIENGILYGNEKPNKLTTSFIKLVSETEEKIKKKLKKSNAKEIDSESPDMDLLMLTRQRSSQTFETKLYKLFYFDEEKFKWIFDSELFDTFLIDKKINVEGSRTPLIFYFNSNEKDLTTINTNFIIGRYPNLDDSQIYVYPLCESQLARLNMRESFTNPELMTIKPIFLLLHLPKEKENFPFIRTVIIQIYSFLAFTCDLSICILNDNYMSYQIGILKEVLKISEFSFSKQENLELMLLKNSDVEYKNYDKDQIRQLSCLKMKSYDSKIPINFYIANFDNFETYKPFIDYLTYISLNSRTTIFRVNNIFNKFECSNISGLYIRIILLDSWKEELKKIIKDRFSILKSNDPNFDKNPEIVLNKLHYEFSSFSPINNTEFQNECNMSYNSMRKTFTKQNNNLIVEELKKSSNENIKVLKDLLLNNDNNNYWTKNQIENMIINHIRFLKNEYFNIIKSTSDLKMIHFIYQDNLEILNSQIESDKKIFEDIKKPILENFKIKNTVNQIDAQESSKRGTNYTLKETENVREIEISVVNSEELEKKIKQDF